MHLPVPTEITLQKGSHNHTVLYIRLEESPNQCKIFISFLLQSLSNKGLLIKNVLVFKL